MNFYLFALFLAVLNVQCTNSGVSCSKITGRVLLLSNNVENDTISFVSRQELVYHHSGIGANFTGRYECSDNEISIKLYDFARQYGLGLDKKLVKEFKMRYSVDSIYISEIYNVDDIFSAINTNAGLQILETHNSRSLNVPN